MYKARTGYRSQQDERMKQLEDEVTHLRQALSQAQLALANAQNEAQRWKKACEGRLS